MGGGAHGGHATGASDAMQQDLFDAGPDAQLFNDEVIEARVGGIGACGGDYVGDVVDASTPFLDGFPAGLDGQWHAVETEEVIQLLDARWIGLIDERMVDIANGSAGFDAGEAVDGKDLLESEGRMEQELVRAETQVNLYNILRAG